MAVQDFLKLIDGTVTETSLCDDDDDFKRDSLSVSEDDSDENQENYSLKFPVSKIRYLVKKIRKSEQINIRFNSCCSTMEMAT